MKKRRKKEMNLSIPMRLGRRAAWQRRQQRRVVQPPTGSSSNSKTGAGGGVLHTWSLPLIRLPGDIKINPLKRERKKTRTSMTQKLWIVC